MSNFQIISGRLDSQPNDMGGNTFYTFNVGGNTFNHQNNANTTILTPQQLGGLNSTISGSVTGQTPNPSGNFDQCNGYRLTISVQYTTTRTVNKIRLVPRAPN
ncbi:hypothetical protein D3C80_1883460 [compost metagenome]